MMIDLATVKLGFKKAAETYVDGLGNMAMIDTGTGSMRILRYDHSGIQAPGRLQ